MSASGGCSPAGQGSGLGPGMSMFPWLEVLEKAFDKAFVAVDLLLGAIAPDQVDITYEGRQKMTSLSSCFAQLCHKTQTVFQLNHKLEVSSCCMIHGHCYTVKLRVVRTSCLHPLMVSQAVSPGFWFVAADPLADCSSSMSQSDYFPKVQVTFVVLLYF